ncbi:DUF413 domain-containing protein [Ruminobacter sp. RM87]|uniref:DUF413 domain-containing protein n=1 Tax=Ruminobacter sp. RM87 TaxID=1200567 RepID=UPI0004E0E096|nr:DUF413 domain-containing protein [Ruminobacter sp. RM87]
MSFESDKSFNDFVHFPRGIRRSGLFSIKESDLLEECGDAMMELYQGVRKPKDDAEKTFVEQIKGEAVITDLNAKVFKKYLYEISPKKSHNLTTSTDDDGYDSSEESID